MNSELKRRDVHLSCWANREALGKYGGLVYAGVLKRAQWVKYLGVFFNLDGPATDIYNTINTTFYNVAATIDTNISVGSPILAFADYYSFAPYNAYEISLATYKQQYASVSPSSPITYDVLFHATLNSSKGACSAKLQKD